MKGQTRQRVLAYDPATTRRQADPRPQGVKYATGRTDVSHQARCGVNVTGNDHQLKYQLKVYKNIKLGTWNVRGMITKVKKEIIDQEQTNYQLDILALTESHMRGSGFYETPCGHTIYYSGPENESRNGVALSVSDRVNKAVIGYNPVSDRIMTVKLNTKPCRMHLIVVYAPTSSSSEADIDTFYRLLEDTIKLVPNRDIMILLGDLNAKVGSTENEDHLREIVGRYGLGERNERGEMWLQFCVENSLTITNTCFQQHPRRLYTWVMPGDRARNQIDYIAISKRWRSSIRSVRTYPGAYCGSDHRLLVATMRIKLKRCLRAIYKPQKRLNPDELSAFRTCLNTKILDFNVDTSADINTNWTSVKNLLLTTRDEIRTRDKADNPNKEWITEETWKVIKQRKDLLKGNTDTERTQYRRLSARIQYLCRRDYNEYLNNICEDIERHSKTIHTSDLFLKIKNITRESKPKTWAVEDGAGNLLTEIDQVTERWRSYCEGLYADGHNQRSEDRLLIDPNNLEPEILESEIRCALYKLKNNKSAGRDKVYAEELKQIGDKGIKILLDLCNQVWRTGQWPNDWKESMLIPIHKKGSTRLCSNYRTVALTSHASKIMLYVINERLKTFLQWQIPEEQAGFVRGRGTREQIVNVRQLIEKSREFCRPILLCFIDYSKAFDCVRWDCLWKILLEMGVPEHLAVLITNLYKDGETVVRVNDAVSGPFGPEKGVRQGCILSPLLFNIYGEFIMRRALDDWQGGISIGGKKISNLRYADDTTLIASSEEELGELFSRVQYESEQVGLTVNRAKTKVLIVDRAGTLTRTGELSDLEFVSEFLYLGSLLTD
ncbi:unnamed protein product [Euphydryas editha]|uniref:Reverse transcriptase domain-containing protein n=1 Tax=Euphydryas editha TaxID=104508 RepID=A0AAU9VA99_EUPED|nr:unnamed protein product [Euphydryas editha]